MEITNNTRIIDLTVGQLKELFASMQQPVIEEKPKRLVYGIGINEEMTIYNNEKDFSIRQKEPSRCYW